MAKKTKKTTITLDQERKLLLKPCKTRDELKAWIRYFLNLSLPDVTVSRYSDTNPLDVVWEVYDICVNKNNPEKIKELLFVAGRGSGKCSVQGTEITTQFGPKVIENITTNDTIWTGWSWQPVLETFIEGIKDGVTITTKKGKKDGAFSLTGSLKHRIQAFNSETQKIDWILMKDLIPGQLVYKTAERVYDDLINTSSEEYEKGWIIGNITGDGCVSRHGNSISLCGKDDKQIDHYRSLMMKFFSVAPNISSSSRSKLIKKVSISNKSFRTWHDSIIEGELCYFKKLRTLDHTPNFLAGFIAGLMETDGSKDSITFANRELTQQVAQILTLFGVNSVINNSRRPPSTTKFEPGHIVIYHEAKFTDLPSYMMPLFSKRKAFMEFRDKQNEQFRYPAILIKAFAEDIKSKYDIANGYWRLSNSSKKTHSNIEFSKDLWGAGDKSKESWIYGYKIDSFIKLAMLLKEDEWAQYLRFIRNGHYEEINTVAFGQHYFYDLEVAVDHAYASNGFVSHNTLGMAIAELAVLLHDKREVVHVGAIQNQAERCYAYQKGFLYNRKLKPLVMPSGVPEDLRILEKANMSKSLFNMGGEKITLEVIPCTLKACLVADTLAESIDGSVMRLEQFKIGSHIRSPNGFVEVIDNSVEERECLRVELDDGRIIEGTLDHKILCESGWVMLKDISDSDIIL